MITEKEIINLKKLIGKNVKLNHAINNSGFDDSRYDGSEGEVFAIDSMGQIHFTGCGIAIIPESDDWEVVA